eukprot:scaffold111042_cov19-Tisochrysis_lutea.AAC.1
MPHAAEASAYSWAGEEGGIARASEPECGSQLKQPRAALSSLSIHNKVQKKPLFVQDALRALSSGRDLSSAARSQRISLHPSRQVPLKLRPAAARLCVPQIEASPGLGRVEGQEQRQQQQQAVAAQRSGR